MNPVLIDLGYVQIYWYSVCVFLGMLLGGTVLYREARKFDVPDNFITNLFFWTIPVSLIGARLYYVAFNFNYYSDNLIDILKVWEGGLAIYGAVIAAILYILRECKKKGKPFIETIIKHYEAANPGLQITYPPEWR